MRTEENSENLFIRGINKFFTQLKLDIELALITPRRFIILFVNIIFVVLLLCSAMSLLITSMRGILIIYSKKEVDIIKGIELIFISPLPLIIISAFHSYFKRIISPTISFEKKDIEYADINRNKALKDLGIIKYLFISILISTTFVVILKVVFKLTEPSSDAKGKDIAPYGIEEYLPIIVIAIILLVFLLVYFKMLARHVDHDNSEDKVLGLEQYKDDLAKIINDTESKLKETDH